MSRKNQPALPIQREDEVQGGSRYRSIIEAAKQRGSSRERPGPMQNTPAFDQKVESGIRYDGPGPQPDAELSDDTQRGLDALNRQMQAQTTALGKEEEEESGEMTLQEIQDRFGLDTARALAVELILYPERDNRPEQELRRRIESRCSKIDLGQYLMNGIASQRVTIIEPADDGSHEGLKVAYQTILDAMEVYIDRQLSIELAKFRATTGRAGRAGDMSQREYERRNNEWFLAAHIFSYQGTKWPNIYTPDGEIRSEAMEDRLQRVRKLPTRVFTLLSTNLGWFMDRVANELTVAALGNG